MEVSVEQLFNMLQAEKKTGEIIPLPANFYKKAGAEADSLEKSSPDPQHPTNFRKLLSSIKERRTQKLLIYLAYNKQLPGQMPDEEEQLFKSIRSLINGGLGEIARTKKVRISADIPELIMPNGGKTGPYKQNQVVEFAEDYEADFLLSNKLGEKV
ncbi:MAG: DNA replication complex GINS family protein [Candidatus Micrarchaeota archaeon]|nr:DNA replication complex GINS family protein [Candidatus Micrarchaeota archaeon]